MYVRVSTQRQAQAQTIEQQLEVLRVHSQTHTWEWNDEHIFRDDGYSGASLRRPGLDQLRDRVSCAAFDLVMITAPDRLARNYVHQMLLIEELQRGGCQIEFVDHPMSQDPHDQLLLQIRGAVAEYERNLIAERMRRGRLQKYHAGSLLPWTRAPYGYRVDPAHPRDPAGVRVEPVEAAMVAELFATYLQDGQSLIGVTKHLMGLKIPTPSGHLRWNQATVHGILSNPAYLGTVYIGLTRPTTAHHRHSALTPIGRVRGGHSRTDPHEWTAVAQIPAVVSQEHFDLVQGKLAHNQQFASRNNTAHSYLLRALVSCGVCSLACTGRSDSRHKYAYYTCRGKSHPIVSCRDEKCPSRFIPADQLDALVWQDVCEVLMHPEQIALALERAQGGAWLPQELQARRENLRKARVSIEHQLERLTEAYLAKVLELDEFKRRRQELDQRLQAIAGQVRQLEASVGHRDELAAMAESITLFCQRVQQGLTEATFEQKRQLVELLIDRVVVSNEEVEIRYVIPTSPRSEHLRFCHLRSDYFALPALLLVHVPAFFGKSTQRSTPS
jgi:site-specific DNA recombinase